MLDSNVNNRYTCKEIMDRAVEIMPEILITFLAINFASIIQLYFYPYEEKVNK